MLVAIRRGGRTGGFGSPDQIQRGDLLPLLPILALLRTRKLGWWLLGLAMPLMMVAGYELITAHMYGKGLLAAASHFARTVRGGDYWKNARGITGLAFAGGSLLPLLFFAPLLWRRWVLLAGGFVILGVWLGMFDLWNKLVWSGVADILNVETVGLRVAGGLAIHGRFAVVAAGGGRRFSPPGHKFGNPCSLDLQWTLFCDRAELDGECQKFSSPRSGGGDSSGPPIDGGTRKRCDVGGAVAANSSSRHRIERGNSRLPTGQFGQDCCGTHRGKIQNCKPDSLV